METILSGDIGGTNASFALFHGGVFAENTLLKLPVAEHADLADTIEYYLQHVAESNSSIDRIALSVASTADYCDSMALTNNNVTFSVSGLVERYALRQARVVNDFTAAALGVFSLQDENLQVLQPGVENDLSPKALIGPGTGLGVSGLIHSGSHWIPLQSQGGHMTMGALTKREFAIREILSTKHGDVSAERYVSGTGLVGVYEAICQLDGHEPCYAKADDISAAAFNNGCETCCEVMSLFCKNLGIVASDIALTLGAEGGIYITGGIVPKLGTNFNRTEFLSGFHSKGRFSDFAKSLPVWMISGGESALFGAFHSLQPHYDNYGYTVRAA